MGNQNVSDNEVTEKEISVFISQDKMSAMIELAIPEEDNVYTEQEIVEALNDNGVKMGINTEIIQDMLQRKLYLKHIEVAKGKVATDGVDGYYNYYFNTEIEKQRKNPKVLPDGSVDYLNIEAFASVKANEKIAEYIEPTTGEYGYTVTGVLLNPKRGKNLVPLRGKGFSIGEDKVTYFSMLDGKIDFQNGRIVISNLYELNDDVSVATGHINFNGDVSIKGNIVTGMKVIATGCIVVEGTVEAATLIAGKDIMLKRGMQGKGRGEIQAGGNVSGKFFESVKISAKGTVEANSLMNCNIEAGEAVILDGKYGALLGGRVHAIGRVAVSTIGNVSEIPTTVEVGVTRQIVERYSELGKLIERCEEEVEVLQKSIRIFEKMEEKSKSSETDARKIKIFRAKIIKTSELNSYYEERKKIIEQMEKGNNCHILVRGWAHAGVKIDIESNILYIKEKVKNVTFKLKGIDVVMYPNEIDKQV